VDLDNIIFSNPKCPRRTIIVLGHHAGSLKTLGSRIICPNMWGPDRSGTWPTVGHQGIEHRYVVVEPIEKLEISCLFFLSPAEGERIIFCKTSGVNKLGKNFWPSINFRSGAIHVSVNLKVFRDRVMGQFRKVYMI